MDTMESKMNEWRRRMPSKRALTSQLGQFVQQKSVAVLYTQTEQERIKSVSELIAKATCEFEKDPHWDRIMKVVDVLSNTSNKHVLKEAIRSVRLRLGDPSPQVVLLALTLTEALVKNCNRFVHKEIATEAFMGEMESLYKIHSHKRGRDSMEIESRVLELIQAWGEAFMHQKFEYPYFIYPYEKLRKKGARFPKYNRDTAPVHTPPPRSSLSSSSSSASGKTMSKTAKSSIGSNSAAAVGKSTGTLSKLSSKEVYHVATNVADMFEDMIHEAEKDAPSIADRGVIVELASQAKELVERLETVIQSAAESGSDELGKYLSVNDTLRSALTRYGEIKRGRASTKGNNQEDINTRRQSTASSTTNNQNDDDDDDDEFGDFVRSRVSSDAKSTAFSNSHGPAADNQTDASDDDPFADFAQHRASKSKAPSPEPTKNLIDLWGDAPLQPQTQQPSSAHSTQAADPWGTTLLMDPVSAPAAVAAPAATPTPSLDDIWGDLTTAPIPVVQPAAPPAAAPAATTNPFDFFDEFTTKATVSGPTTIPAAKATPQRDPFDFSLPPPPAPVPTRAPAPAMSSANPFDF